MQTNPTLTIMCLWILDNTEPECKKKINWSIYIVCES